VPAAYMVTPFFSSSCPAAPAVRLDARRNFSHGHVTSRLKIPIWVVVKPWRCKPSRVDGAMRYCQRVMTAGREHVHGNGRKIRPFLGAFAFPLCFFFQIKAISPLFSPRAFSCVSLEPLCHRLPGVVQLPGLEASCRPATVPGERASSWGLRLITLGSVISVVAGLVLPLTPLSSTVVFCTVSLLEPLLLVMC